jgi:beta-glucosidase
MSTKTALFWGLCWGLCSSVSYGQSTAAVAETASVSGRLSIEQQTSQWLEQLTLKEKVSLMSGANFWNSKAIDRLGIPSFHVTDGPNGVRSNNSEATTLFPTGVAMAATWNPSLIQDVGVAIGKEARAQGAQVLLGPNLNIQRTPLAGRNFEAYSEDPYLTGAIGVGFVLGVQSENIGTSPKHFIANNQEYRRHTVSANIDQRTLREIYMPGFEQVVKQAKPWTIMAAYNRVNGVYMTENKSLLEDVLRDEWGFNGLVVSDWGALHSTVPSANAGLDLEMPGPGRQYGSALVDAVNNGEIPEAVIDKRVASILHLTLKARALNKNGNPYDSSQLNTLAHQQLSQQVAEEAITLLKNDRQLLPLNLDGVRSIALIGPNADVAIMQGGGSSQVVPYQQSTPLEGLTALLADSDNAVDGITLTYAQGVDNEPDPATMDARLLSPDLERTAQGLKAEYFANKGFSGKPLFSATDQHFAKLGFAEQLPTSAKKNFSVRWSGYFWPKVSGQYDFDLVHMSEATLTLDGQVVISNANPIKPSRFLEFLNIGSRGGSAELIAGKAYPIELEYVSGPMKIPVNLLRLASRAPAGDFDSAVALAKKADLAIVFVGVSTTSESEGRDRADLALYGEQNALIEAVLAANKNTVVVLNNGSPLEMPWIAKADTVVEAWLPGQQGGHAIARMLMGHSNPSGKLPLTFPKTLQDNPTHDYYPGDDEGDYLEGDYGEGIFVGYRYYDSKQVEPLFPFGHGLSYTSFAYSDLSITTKSIAIKSIATKSIGTKSLTNKAFDPNQFTVSVKLKNTGSRAGQEVVQLYIEDETSSVPRPLKELKGFQKIRLSPGESATLKFELSRRDLSFYDIKTKSWLAEPGLFKILIGSSSRDIRQKIGFELLDQQGARAL